MQQGGATSWVAKLQKRLRSFRGPRYNCEVQQGFTAALRQPSAWRDDPWKAVSSTCMVLPLLDHCCETKMFVGFLKGIGENLGEDNEKSQKLKNTKRQSWIHLSQVCSKEQTSPGKQAGRSLKEASFFWHPEGKIQFSSSELDTRFNHYVKK